MKKIFLRYSILILALFFGTSSFATHIMGGEITWECLNNGQYVFTLKVYRDCNGINYNTNNLAIEVHDYPSAGNITLIPVNFFSVEDITPSCEGSPCATLQRSDPDIAGAIEEYILRSAPVTLNGVPPATGWAFTWTSGNRNAAIDNINNAQNFGITLRAIMFPYFGQNANLCFDSSPDFYQKPSTIICAGEKFTYNHSAFDVDLDSLAYDWARPLEGNLCGTSPCQIGGVFTQGINPPEIPFDGANGYSFNSPYPGTMQDPANVPAVLDPETGEITFTSNTNGEFVSVIKVTAYKCGQKVAEIYRELQTVIASGCASNEPPVISTLANNSYRDTVKVGDTVRFRVSILDSIRADNPNVDSIFVFASGQQFGTNFTDPNAGCLNPPCAILTSPLPDTGIGRYTTDFYWETTCDHIQNTTPICYATANSYQFIVRAFDNFCPAAGQTIATYTITILADSLVNNPDINCATVDGNGDVTIDWDGIYDPDKTFSAYLLYVADFRNGPYTLLDSIFDSTLTSYTHIGAGADASSKHYIVRVRSGCQAGWTILPTDTISTFYIDPILNDTCISLNWSGLTTPISADSDTNYLIYREYPIGSGFVLYDSTNLLSYCDTFPVCTDTVTYRIELGSNSGDCPGSTSNTQGLRFKYPDPVADFTFITPCSDLTIPFTNTTTVVPDSIAVFNWDFGDGGNSTLKNPSHTYASPGSYTVTLITTSTKGCIDSVSKVVTPDVPFAEAGPDETICLRDSVQIGGTPTSTSANVTYNWTPTNGVSDPSIANPRVSPLDTTTYKVLVTNLNGCTNVDSMVIFVKPLPNADAGNNPTICVGDTVTIGGSPSSTTAGVTYSWQPANGLSNATDPNPRAFPTTSTTYELTVSAPNGCSDTSTVTVIVNNLPIVDAGSDKNICLGQTIGIGGGPTGPVGSTYSWTPTTNISNSSISNPNVFPTVNTTYIVEVTDTNGCVARDSVDVLLQPSPVANAGANRSICKEDFPIALNGTVTVSNSGSWIGGNGVFTPDRNTLNATYAATPAEINAGFVELQLVSTNVGICTPDTDLVRITIPPFTGSVNLVTSNVTCNGQSDAIAYVNVTGVNSPYTYRWNTNTGVQTGDTARGFAAGNYTLTITNNLGCDSILGLTITEPAVLTSSISTSTNVSCNGGSDGTATVTPTGGTTPYSYAWPSGTPTANETGLSQGTYVVTVTDANGCTSTSSVSITEPTVLTSSISASVNVSCNGGSDGTATVTPTGGTTPYSYAWPSGTPTANETGLSQGTYVVTVTDANGCTSTSSVTLTEPTVLTSSIGTSTNVSCNGGSDGTATVTPTGGTTPYSYAWPSGTPTANETGLSQGTYAVTVTDANGCTSTSSVTITEPTVLNTSISSSVNVSCNGGSDGTATVTPTGGTTPYTFAWPSGTPTANETGLSQGTYVVTVTDANGCTSTSSVTLTEPTVLTSSIGTSTNVSCNGGSDGTATVTPTGGTTPYTFAWPSGTTAVNETGLSQGTYVVTVTDANGCTSTSSVTITEPTVLTSSISSSVNVSCNGGSDGTAVVTPTGGTTPYSYAWPSGTPTANETGLSQGTYIVTVTDANGCTSTSSVTLTEPTVLTSSIGTSTNVSCNGGSDGTATVTPTGGTTPYSYAWPSGTLTANETGLSQGTYVVTITDANGCTSTSSVTITEPTVLNTSISSSVNVSCNGGSDGTATVTPTGGTTPYSYAWPSGAPTANETGLSQGTYVVTVTDANGCTSTGSVTITEPTVLSSSIGTSTNVSCNGGSDGTATVTPTGGTTPYSYTWPSGTPTANETGLSQGTYVVTVTDANGCTSMSSVTITEPTVLTSSISTSVNVSCNGGSDGTATVTPTGGTTPYSYAWPSGTPTANETGLSQGTYVVTVTDANGCTSISSVTLTEPTVLTSSIGTSTNVSCNGGSDGTATVTPSGGTTPYTYAWPSGTLTANETGLSQGSYVVTVSDANGCTSTSSVTITEPNSIQIAIINVPVSCFGLSDGQLTAPTSGGTPPYSFNWANGILDSINPGLAIGNYLLTVTDANGCTSDTAQIITQPNPIALTVSPPDTICIGSSTTIQATATGGNSTYTYNWNNNLNSSRSHVVSPTIKTTYTVSVNDEKGCSTTLDSIPIEVRNISNDKLEAFSSGNICAGESTTISATHNGTLGGYFYTWSNNVGNGLGPITVSPNSTTTYIIGTTDECGIILSDSVQVIVEDYPVVNLPSIIKSGCEPLTVNFIDSLNGSTNNLTYNWDLGDGTTSTSKNFIHTYNSEGTYSVSLSISTPNGCESTAANQSQVIVYPTPIANFNMTPSVTDLKSPFITFNNTSAKEDNIEWDFYDSFMSFANDTVIELRDTGWFQIKLYAYNQFGCEDSITKNLRINPVYEIIVPNAFTPNSSGGNGGFYNKNDLSNDVFYVHSDLVQSYEMQIYNRWGELIFVSNDVNRGWDGYYLGKLSPQDVYVYKVTVQFINGKTETKTGNFTLFR